MYGSTDGDISRGGSLRKQEHWSREIMGLKNVRLFFFIRGSWVVGSRLIRCRLITLLYGMALKFLVSDYLVSLITPLTCSVMVGRCSK